MEFTGYDGDHPALELINSERWYGRRPDGGEDVLADPAWLAGYLERWSFGGVPPAEPADLRRLATLRTLLRQTYTTISATRSARPEDVRALDEVAARALLRRRLATAADGAALRLTLEPMSRDWDWVAAEVAASLVDLLSDGDWERVKLCENVECRCAFYDESKNRSRRWCYPQVCGNLHKVRQFRARKRAAG